MAGFDALYINTASDSELAGVVMREGRVLLTRDRYLLMRSDVDRGYWVRSTDAKQQLMEVARRFYLAARMRPFTRCMKCNHVLDLVARDSVLQRLPPKVREKKHFSLCAGCGAVYWEGTHHARMNRILEWLKANAGVRPGQLNPGATGGGPC
jgi:uncharacterized protein with PIN domain